jgi:thiamine biosynthesis lipoprotein
MPLRELLPVDDCTTQWSVWGTSARLVVTEPAALGEATEILRRELAGVDATVSRFRSDSELMTLPTGRPVRVSPLLAKLMACALLAAERTDGDVDPTVGDALVRLGYDRDFELIGDRARLGSIRHVRRLDWRQIAFDGRQLTVPDGTRLDLGATAKAFAADTAAELIAGTLGVGVLVSLGGDVATAGAEPSGGWHVLVSDGPGEPDQVITVPAGAAVATSSTIARTWSADGQAMHHIVDPRTGWPVPPVWRTVSVGAWRCVEANAYATAAIVRGMAALRWLRLPARLVSANKQVHTVHGWPAPGEAG